MSRIPQTWQMVNEEELPVLETVGREPLDNLNRILTSKLDYPFRLQLTNTTLTFNSSEIQTLKSDGSLGTIPSFKIGTAPIQGQYKATALSTIDFSSGAITGDMATGPFCPTMSPGYFIWLGFELKSDGKINVTWGNQSNDINTATKPIFSGTAICLVPLQDGGSGGTWNFIAPNVKDIIIFKGSGGGSGSGGTDFVPLYKTSLEYKVQGTQGRYVRFNEKYYYSNEDFDFSFDLSSDKTWYICFDTSKDQGLVNSSYFVETELNPENESFPDNLIVLGMYTVSGGAVSQNDFIPFSINEKDVILGDLTISYDSSSQYRVQNTTEKLVYLNGRYYYLDNDLLINYNTSVDGFWTICLDTEVTSGGLLTSANFIATQANIAGTSFSKHLVPLAFYQVVSGTVSQNTLTSFSTRSFETNRSEINVSENLTKTGYYISNTRYSYFRFNNKYYYTSTLLSNLFDISTDGKWYICLDTTNPSGLLNASYFVNTQLDPNLVSFPQNYIVLGEYTVSSGSYASGSLLPYTLIEKKAILDKLSISYLNNTSYIVQNTEGLKLNLHNKYFWLNNNVVSSFTTSASGKWYACLDTDNPSGEINSSYFVNTQEYPTSTSFDPDYIALGEYEVDITGTVLPSTLIPYSLLNATKNIEESFVPLYYNELNFSIKPTLRKVKFNNNYYWLTSEIVHTFDTSLDGTWYICLDTSLGSGEIDLSYIALTQLDPHSNLFNPYYIILGEYTVASGVVLKTTFNGYSTRESVSFVNGLPNIKRKAETKTASGFYTLIHNFNQSPDVVTYKYWSQSNNQFYNYERSDIELNITSTEINYVIPDSDPNMPFDSGDYFEVECFLYVYAPEGGFASPKTDYSTGWYVTTPNSVITHSLFWRPQNISLEFNDNGIYYIEDGNQFVDKSLGGITQTNVTFDWTGLPTLSTSLQMRIHFNLSKVSAGAFTADKIEPGLVTTSGLSTVANTPDLILDATNTNFATTINSAGNNISVLVKESITITSEQVITSSGISWNMLPGAYIICSTDSLASMIKFSGADYEVENLRMLSQANITSGLKLANDGIIKNLTLKQNAIGKTLVNAVEVVSGNIATVIGRAKTVSGTITNKINDVDGNSEIIVS